MAATADIASEPIMAEKQPSVDTPPDKPFCIGLKVKKCIGGFLLSIPISDANVSAAAEAKQAKADMMKIWLLVK